MGRYNANRRKALTFAIGMSPCDKHACPYRCYCAETSEACKAFVIYVRTGTFRIHLIGNPTAANGKKIFCDSDDDALDSVFGMIEET